MFQKASRQRLSEPACEAPPARQALGQLHIHPELEEVPGHQQAGRNHSHRNVEVEARAGQRPSKSRRQARPGLVSRRPRPPIPLTPSLEHSTAPP